MTDPKFAVSESGALYPVSPEPMPIREYGLLEIYDAEDREILQKCLSHLLNSPGCAGWTGKVTTPVPIIDARRRLLLHVAEELLGTDFDYREKT